MPSKLSCVDLFAGAGGFSLGFKQAGFDVKAAVDRSEDALKTYAHNQREVQTIQADLQDVNAGKLSRKFDFSTGEIDVLIGGPPCKGFSTAGRRDPSDPKNSLVANYINLISEISPEAVVMENVTGILTLEDGFFKEQIIEALKSEGYHVPEEPYVLNAANYGVPQQRERVFFLASKQGVVDRPSPTHSDPSLNTEESPETTDKEWVTIEDAIDDLSYLTYGEESEEYRLRPISEYQREMRKGADNSLYNHKATNHSKKVRQRFSHLNPGQTGKDLPEDQQTKKHSLQRWHHLQTAPTVTTLPDDFIHHEKDRIPTVRELARIQSFPDDFEFKGSRTTGGKRRRETVPQYSQVGNAVPPKLAKAVARSVRDHLVE